MLFQMCKKKLKITMILLTDTGSGDVARGQAEDSILHPWKILGYALQPM